MLPPPELVRRCAKLCRLMDKAYNPKKIEDQIYKRWESSGFFNPDNLEGAADRYWKAEVFSVAMPPPNVTGVLHLGHALENALMDTAVRYQRMRGKKTLLLPGTDHAAIATQNVVERQIWEEDKKTRHEIGREEFLKRVEEFILHTQGRIQQQIRKMGTSADWSREKYTLSPELSRGVRAIFQKMYDAGLIYRGDRIVNWCPRCGTTLADDEVEYKLTKGALYYIRYPVVGSGDELVIATTRPETMLADTAVAVHPADSRYKKFVDKSVMLPLLNREIPVIADKYVDPKYGTGVLKVTPGHDPNDFEIGKRHKLDSIHLLTPEGKIDTQEAYDHGFEAYAGLDVADARKHVLADLGSSGFLDKTEEMEHSVGHCYRCGTVIEPIVSKQWFVNVNEKLKIKNEKFKSLLKLKEDSVSLKEIAAASVKSGAVKITPKKFEKVYLNWTENLLDWNISRQIWFGHQIPVWYRNGETHVGSSPPEGEGWEQDPDTLDTWFSSGLWPFSTLGWPEQTEDLNTFYPTSWMQMGYEILFLWMTRMVIMSAVALEQVPFRQVYFHGILRNKQGKKFSKSDKTGVDPIVISEKYGTDALRLSLIAGVSPGNDARFYEEKVKRYKNFVNKLWNISRFILNQTENEEYAPGEKNKNKPPKAVSLADSWILDRLSETTADVNKCMEKYEFSQSAALLYEFTWHEFADWYIEISKIKGQKSNSKEILPYVLEQILKLWHPFAPFVTEYIWAQSRAGLLFVEEYPDSKPKAKAKRSQAETRFSQLQELITGLRALRSEYRLAPAEIFACYMDRPKKLAWLSEQAEIVERLARVKLNFDKVENRKMPYFLWQGTKVWLIIPGFDPKKEKALAEKNLAEADAAAKKLSAQLDKKDFLQKAPPEVVEKMKADFEAAKEKAEKLKAKIKGLK